MNLYAENILDHYRHPRGKCDIANATFGIRHSESNTSCGDEITIGLTIENEKIIEMGWDGTGCAISQAAMSMLFEELEGKEISAILNLSDEDVLELLGVPISNRRMNCALMSVQALRNAIQDLSTT